MAVSGELMTMCLADVLQWINLSRKTGRLTIESGTHTCKIYFKEGRIITTSSTDPRSYLGQFLLAFSDVTEEQLKAAFKEQERSRVQVHKGIFLKTLLGRILVDQGAIAVGEMQRILQLKAEESVHALFLWEVGIFTFEDAVLPASELVPIDLDLAVVINKGIRRLEEWKDIRSVFPGNNVTLKTFRERIPPASRLNRMEWGIFELAERDMTIEEIACEFHCYEFKIFEILYRFFKAGYVEIAEVRVTEETVFFEQGSVQDLLDITRSFVEEKRFEQGRQTAQAILKEDPTNREAREILIMSEKEMIEEILSKEIPPESVPTVLGWPESTKTLTAAERYLLGRLKRGTADIHTLLKLSPLGQYESLRALKNLANKGIITFAKPGA